MLVNTPVLSICVPSRNRQYYFQETIKALTSSLRTDVEFVFCDNSDDPSMMKDFIAPYLADPRVVFVPSGETTRPMVDNWEMALKASSGRWIAVIGDDDHIDPELAGLILRIEEQAPDVEALDWMKLYYSWPYQGKPVLSNPVHLQSEIHEVPKQSLLDRAFRWDHAREVLGCGFGIYHGAVSRTLMERIRALSKEDRYFEHPIVDFDNIFKVIMHGKRFVHCRRPLSVLGVCPESNSAAVKTPERMRQKQEEFDKEHASPVDKMDCYRGFPFHTRLGLAACILMTQHWFADKYGFRFTGYEENFVNSCSIQCSKIADRDQYDLIVNGYRKALATWKNGKYLKRFKPEFKEPEKHETFAGLLKQDMFLTDDHPAWSTVKSFYDIASSLIQPITTLELDLGRYQIAPDKRLKRA
jgi:glycosyltransferase involved in cell wall biosynthesis